MSLRLDGSKKCSPKAASLGKVKEIGGEDWKEREPKARRGAVMDLFTYC